MILAPPTAAGPRHGSDVADRTGLIRRFTRSAAVTDSPVTPNRAILSWLEENRRIFRHEVTRIPFADLVGWRFDAAGGDLGHESGRFFTVEGLRIHTDAHDWMQPIINQPEIGILGFVAKEFDGVLHFLMQAKMEPGNINSVQLSPTVQATRSNYTGVHRGRPITFLEHFVPPTAGTVLLDSLQSEQGAWFLRKRNRNIVVEITEEPPELPDFRWLTLGQIHRLLGFDDVVNMDARTVLSSIPLGPRVEDQGAYRSLTGVLSWLTRVRATSELSQRYRPLRAVEGWQLTGDRIRHEEGRYFQVIAAAVTAANREVASWTQPLFEPIGLGVTAFLVRPIGGVLHLLAHARVEAGLANVAEIAPTVQCCPDNYAGLPSERQPRFLTEASTTTGSQVRYDTVLSEEGGRFFEARSRYRIVEVPEDFPLDVPPDFAWISVHQASTLLRYDGYLNVQARTLIAALLATL
ncbi:NDP-hexose 2,3-dehydratase family protein [Kitasatospora sp. NPDC059577]|uniref:NDP-hexose 2,3-dehydratase family protein n=1 Tax=Kitasatospora sp. NPDC059577 TaxID=3346873 RepID=UPI00368C2FC5